MDDNKKSGTSSEGAGRSPEGKPNDQPLQQKAGRDISEIDRQEGSMNNGALGGNFDKPDDLPDDSLNA